VIKITNFISQWRKSPWQKIQQNRDYTVTIVIIVSLTYCLFPSYIAFRWSSWKQLWFLPWQRRVGVSKTCKLWSINTVQICLSPDFTLSTVCCKNTAKFCIACSIKLDESGWSSLHSVLVPWILQTLNPLTLEAWRSTSLDDRMYLLNWCKPDWSIADCCFSRCVGFSVKDYKVINILSVKRIFLRHWSDS